MTRYRITSLCIGIMAGFALAFIATPASGAGDTRRMVECRERCIKRADQCADLCDEHAGSAAGKCKGGCKTIEDRCNRKCENKHAPYKNK